ncbi:MAG: intradiol ring-cleavage dioxygenase [Dehalococcoidia bacterium]
MSQQIDRRRALKTVGVISLGALVAACTASSSNPPAVTPTQPAGDAAATPTAEPVAATTPTATSTTGGSRVTSVEDFAAGETCVVTPEQTEGPFYLDTDLVRRDITEGKEGTPLLLAVRVTDAGSCEPIRDAVVDVWHCDALGEYSGVETGSDETFLRGLQVTDGDGIAEFETIYPGWYMGRTVHIHLKVFLDSAEALTSQLYFPDDVTDAAYKASPYNTRPNRDTTNESDGVYSSGEGTRALLTLTESEAGYIGIVTLGVQRA